MQDKGEILCQEPRVEPLQTYHVGTIIPGSVVNHSLGPRGIYEVHDTSHSIENPCIEQQTFNYERPPSFFHINQFPTSLNRWAQ